MSVLGGGKQKSFVLFCHNQYINWWGWTTKLVFNIVDSSRGKLTLKSNSTVLGGESHTRRSGRGGGGKKGKKERKGEGYTS